ncbi:putative membrane protein [Bradyrhizobium sp. LB7.1]
MNACQTPASAGYQHANVNQAAPVSPSRAAVGAGQSKTARTSGPYSGGGCDFPAHKGPHPGKRAAPS